MTITGRLSAGDLRRLEHACGEALTHHPLQLVVDLTDTTAIDRSAAALLGGLRSRGAELRSRREWIGERD